MPPSETTITTVVTSVAETPFIPQSSFRHGKPAAGEIDIHAKEAPPVEIVWRNVALFVYLHMAGAYGGYLFLTGSVMWQTALWGEYPISR